MVEEARSSSDPIRPTKSARLKEEEMKDIMQSLGKVFDKDKVEIAEEAARETRTSAES